MIRGAWALWLLSLVLTFAAIVIGLRGSDSFGGLLSASVTTWMYAMVALVGLGYATAGLLILRHRIRHVVGWLLLVAGPALVTVFVSAGVGLALHAQGHPLGAWLALVAAVCWWPVVLVAGPWLAIVFPDGRLPGRRWRWPIGASVVALLIGVVVIAVEPDGFAGEDGPGNPLGMTWLPDWIFELVGALAVLVIFGQLLLAVAAVVVRFRRAHGDEREQLKWFASAVLAWAAVFAVTWFIDWDGATVIAVAAFLLVPAAVVVAITRYRLYEIDTLINRTLVYVPLLGIVAGLYAALVALFGRVLTAVIGDTSDAAAIISALILAAVFTPIRKAIEGVVDRHFKPATLVPVTVETALPSAKMWDDPEHAAAVERIVRRIIREDDSRDESASVTVTAPD